MLEHSCTPAGPAVEAAFVLAAPRIAAASVSSAFAVVAASAETGWDAGTFAGLAPDCGVASRAVFLDPFVGVVVAMFVAAVVVVVAVQALHLPVAAALR